MRPGARDHRTIIDALLWLAKTGAPWRDLPDRFGPWRSVATRFYRWTHSDLWDRLLAELRRIMDSRGGVDWEVHMSTRRTSAPTAMLRVPGAGSTARRWAAAVVASAASCTCAAIAVAGRWRSC
jgi:transposase